jgi:ribonucleotide monophosphatase NagD (HAD superfamily)
MAAILLDIDGVLHVSGEPVPGGGDAVPASGPTATGFAS